MIARFLKEIDRELGWRDAGALGEHVYRVAAVLEPRGRAHQADEKRRRLLLLADRAAGHWVPHDGERR